VEEAMEDESRRIAQKKEKEKWCTPFVMWGDKKKMKKKHLPP